MITSAEEFVFLRESDIPDKYRRAANEQASIEVWLDVINRYPEMRQWVAHNKTIPVEILSILATDPDKRVRSMVSMKRKLTPEILEVLATDEYEPVRLRVAQHTRTPRAVLERLVNDPWEQVRDAAELRLLA